MVTLKELPQYLKYIGVLDNKYPPVIQVIRQNSILKIRGKVDNPFKGRLIQVHKFLDKEGVNEGIVFLYPHAYFTAYTDKGVIYAPTHREAYTPMQIPEEEYTLFIADEEISVHLLNSNAFDEDNNLLVALPQGFPHDKGRPFAVIEDSHILSEAKGIVYLVYDNRSVSSLIKNILPLYVYLTLKGKQVRIYDVDTDNLVDYIYQHQIAPEDIERESISVPMLLKRHLTQLQIANGIADTITALPEEPPEILVSFLIDELRSIGLDIRDTVFSLIEKRRQELQIKEILDKVVSEKPQLIAMWNNLTGEEVGELFIPYAVSPSLTFMQTSEGLFFLKNGQKNIQQVTDLIFLIDAQINSKKLPKVRVRVYDTRTKKYNTLLLPYTHMGSVNTLKRSLAFTLQMPISQDEATYIAQFLYLYYKEVKDKLPTRNEVDRYGFTLIEKQVGEKKESKIEYILPRANNPNEGEDYRLGLIFAKPDNKELEKQHHDFILALLKEEKYRIPVLFAFATLVKGYEEEKRQEEYPFHLQLVGRYAKKVGEIVQSIIAPVGLKDDKKMRDIVLVTKEVGENRVGYILINPQSEAEKGLKLYAPRIRKKTKLWGYTGQRFAKWLTENDDVKPASEYFVLSAYYGENFYDAYYYSEAIRLTRVYYNEYYNEEVLDEEWEKETLKLLADMYALEKEENIAVQIAKVPYEYYPDLIEVVEENGEKYLYVDVKKKLPTLKEPLRKYPELLEELKEDGVVEAVVNNGKTASLKINQRVLKSYLQSVKIPTLPYIYNGKLHIGDKEIQPEDVFLQEEYVPYRHIKLGLGL